MASSADTTHAPAAVAHAFGDRLRQSGPPSSLASPALAALVAGEIIPRLMMAHGVAPASGRCAVETSEIDVLAPLALESDARSLLAHVERLLARGIGIDAVMVELLAPVARRLGTWWEEDRCDFLEVTMGLWRLQEVVRELSFRFAPALPSGAGDRPRRALFSAFPGEQHDFGAIMVGELFHRHGWDVETGIGLDMSALLAEVGRHHYDVVGLTVSCDSNSARLPSAILAVRSVSRNPRVRVMIGGRLCTDDATLADRVGADGTAPDARGALIVAEELVEALGYTVACG